MKKKLLITLLSCFLLSSCGGDGCTVTVCSENAWASYYTSNNKLYSKINVSTYFDEDYIVVGAIIYYETTCTIDRKFISSYKKDEIDYSLLEFQDSTGQQVIFNEFDDYKYIFSTSRTIKISYANLSDSEKETIESDRTSFYVNGIRYGTTNLNETEIRKVQYGDDLNSIKFS